MKLKTTLIATASERAMGRFMRAPDHPAEGGESQGAPADDAGQAVSEPKDEGGAKTTEELMAEEFVNHDDDEADDDSTASSGEEDGDDDDDDIDDKGDDEGDDATDADESDEDDDDTDPKPQKKRRVQERIDKLTNESREHEREAQRWREEALRLGASDPTSVGTEAAVPEEPDPSKFQYGEHDVDYIRERAKYDAKVEVFEAQAQASFKSQAAELDARWTKNQAAAEERYSDFGEVVVQGAKDNKWECPPTVALGIKDSDYGPDIAYHLASNPDEASRIAKLTPLEQAREFGRLEEREAVKAERATRRAQREEQNKAPRRVTKAPNPPKRKTRGSGAKKVVNYDTDDFAAFDKMVDSNNLIKTD